MSWIFRPLVLPVVMLAAEHLAPACTRTHREHCESDSHELALPKMGSLGRSTSYRLSQNLEYVEAAYAMRRASAA